MFIIFRQDVMTTRLKHVFDIESSHVLVDRASDL